MILVWEKEKVKEDKFEVQFAEWERRKTQWKKTSSWRKKNSNL